MHYDGMEKAKFLSRPNRFVAEIFIEGEVQLAHVKNTGRCKELLIPGCDIFVQKLELPHRKTNYDLISVYKGERLINMDSQAPNKVFAQWVEEGNFLPDITYMKAETVYQTSRFDFYLETKEKKIFVEVKGVTLEQDGICLFPDAPTQRGVKHLKELIHAAKDGYDAYVVFVVQMEGVTCFTPNDTTHKEFGEALRQAAESGVTVLCYDCYVTESNLSIKQQVPIQLSSKK